VSNQLSAQSSNTKYIPEPQPERERQVRQMAITKISNCRTPEQQNSYRDFLYFSHCLIYIFLEEEL
jgi:hypothetical protein